MGLILFLSVFPVCLVIALGRRRRGANAVVSIVLAIYALVAGAWDAGWIVRAVMGMKAAANPGAKAALLGKAISGGMNRIAIGLIVDVPLLVVAYSIDRRLRRRGLDQ